MSTRLLNGIARRGMRSEGWAVALALVGMLFAGAPTAHGESAKKLTSPEGVFLGLGDVIDRAHIAVAREFNKTKLLDTVTLVLTLEEERVGGERVFLGEFPILLGDTTLVTTAGPDRRWLVEMGVSTEPVAAGSLINACVTTIEHRKQGDVVGPEECRELTPLF